MFLKILYFHYFLRPTSVNDNILYYTFFFKIQVNNKLQLFNVLISKVD